MLGHVAVLVASLAAVGLVIARPPDRDPRVADSRSSVLRHPYPGTHAVPLQDRRWGRRPMRSRAHRPDDARSRRPLRQRPPAQGRGPRATDGRVRPGVLLGRREAVLGDARRVLDRRRLRRRLHAEPDVRGGVLGAHRSRRGRARRVSTRAVVSYEQLLKVFWEDHDPSQGMRQGNDVGTQYRSAIYFADDEQRAAAEATRSAYRRRAATRPATARSPPRSPPSATSTTPSRTTSSTWPRTPAATARSTPPASAAGSRFRPRVTANGFTERPRTSPASIVDKAKDVADDVDEKAGDLVDKVGEKIPDSVKDTAGDIKEKAERPRSTR